MGVFDDSTRKLAGGTRPQPLKPERLAGHYEIYEGYDDGGVGSLRGLTAVDLGVHAAKACDCRRRWTERPSPWARSASPSGSPSAPR